MKWYIAVLSYNGHCKISNVDGPPTYDIKSTFRFVAEDEEDAKLFFAGYLKRVTGNFFNFDDADFRIIEDIPV